MKYYCDNFRHLVCQPYSIPNLHLMAENLDIKKSWFHKDHYDIPTSRIAEITAKCEVVSATDIVRIIGRRRSQMKTPRKRIRYGKDDVGNKVRIYTQAEMEAEAQRNQDVVFHQDGWKVSDSAGH